MTTPFKPTRDQLARVSNGDLRLLKAFETLFAQASVSGTGNFEADIKALQEAPNLASTIAALKLDPLPRSFTDGQIIFVSDKYDFPRAVDGVITLDTQATYFVTAQVDLTGDRIVAAANSAFIGGSTENSAILSTGLTGVAMITSLYSLTIRNLSFTADVLFDLNGATGDQAIDWSAVNFLNCATVGTISNYNNIIIQLGAFLSSANLTLDGTIGTVGFTNTLFSGIEGQTTLTIPATATITRRLRISYSAFFSPTTATALDVSTSASILVESYILDTCNFSGPGTYLSGVQHTDNKSDFSGNNGISNSSSLSNYYMIANATATTISTINTPVKMAGSTTSDSITQRFTNTDNRATYIGAITKGFKVTGNATLTSSSNVQMGLYIALNGAVIAQSLSVGTGNAGGRADYVGSIAIVSLSENDYLEMWVENQSGTQNITGENLNFIVEEI